MDSPVNVQPSERVLHKGGGVTLSGPDATRMMQAFVLASSLRLYAKTKMIPTRGVTITYMLNMAAQFSGKKYKRGQAELAAADVQKWAEEMRAAIPVEDNR